MNGEHSNPREAPTKDRKFVLPDGWKLFCVTDENRQLMTPAVEDWVPIPIPKELGRLKYADSVSHRRGADGVWRWSVNGAESQRTSIARTALAAQPDETSADKATLDEWLRIEARLHASLTRRFGSDAVSAAVAEVCADIRAHNPLIPPVEPSAVEVQEKTMAIGSGFSTPPCMLSPCRCGRDCVPQSSPDERGIVEPIKVGSTLFGAGVRLRTVLDRITRGFNYADNPLPAVPIEPEKATASKKCEWGCHVHWSGWPTSHHPSCTVNGEASQK